MEESDIIDLEKRYWLLKAQSRTGRFDLETFVPLVSPPIHASLSEGKTSLFEGLIGMHQARECNSEALFQSLFFFLAKQEMRL